MCGIKYIRKQIPWLQIQRRYLVRVAFLAVRALKLMLPRTSNGNTTPFLALIVRLMPPLMVETKDRNGKQDFVQYDALFCRSEGSSSVGLVFGGSKKSIGRQDRWSWG